MRALELIEYPGKVENVDRMIATLGGITRISQSLSEQKRLELRYHPKNPYSKPANGDSRPHSGLLLSVRVRRSKRDKDKPPAFEVRVVGHCQRSITFENLCDFQYLPLFKSPTDQTLKFDMKVLVPQSVTDIDYFGRKSAPLLILPQMFARSDTVHSSFFRDDTHEDGQHPLLGVSQKAMHENRDVVVFNMVDGFPTRPDQQLTKRMKIKYVSDEQLAKVKQLFDECPIWTRVALLYESGVLPDKLKCILPFLGYFFSTGPWRTLYVRYGYDPRKDFSSRHYQTFDFRLRFRSGVGEFVTNRKDTIKRKQKNPYDINALAEDINYPYLEEHKLPRSRQCILRYADIHLPKIREMLEKIPTPLTGATCNERTGWLPAGFDAQVRQIVSAGIKEVLRNHRRKEQQNEQEGMENLVDEEDYELDDEPLEEEEDDDGGGAALAEDFEEGGAELVSHIFEKLQNEEDNQT